MVESESVSDSSVETGDTFTFSATVRNQGDGTAGSTTLRYHRSTDSTISSSDTEVGSDSVVSLGPNVPSPESIDLTAPSSAGTYYYGACVDSVTGESSTTNNCSSGVSVTVSDSHSGRSRSCGGVGVSQRQQCGDRGHVHVQRHRAQPGRRHGWVHHPALPPLQQTPPSPAATPRSAPTAW